MTRTRASRAIWTASAAAAVGLGILAASVGGADASPPTQPASATGAPQSTSSPGSGNPAPADPSTGEQVTVAGTVSATCDGDVVSLSATPEPGWTPDDSPRPGQVEWRNGTQEVEVTVTCVDGSPRFAVEGPRDDRRGRGGDDSPATAPSSDDTAGRSGGGHGSDDAPGDDSAGRSGGGHGSDDPPGDDSAGRSGGGHGSDDAPGDDSAGRVDDRSGSDDGTGDDSGRGRGRGRGGDDSGGDD
ncbi:hypothetical protein ACI782_09140 [Geodermatophilus sp. SYSU D00703]